MVRTDEYLYKVNHLNTDAGWITESPVFSESFSYESRTNAYIGKNPDYMWNVKFTISNILDVYNRKYVRLQTVFANVGGFLKAVMVIFTFVNNYFTNNFFIDELFMKSHEKYKQTLNFRYPGSDRNIAFKGNSGKNSLNKKKSDPSKMAPLELEKKENNNYEGDNVMDSPTTKEQFITTEGTKFKKKKVNKKSTNTNTGSSNSLSASPSTTPLKANSSDLNFDDIRPIRMNDVFCPCLKNKRQIYINKFESIYKTTLDIRNIFIDLRELNFINKLIFSKNQRNLEKLALHKSVIKKSLGLKTEKLSQDKKPKKNNIRDAQKKSALFTKDIFEELVANAKAEKNEKTNDLNFDEKLLMYFQ
jgi:hypothetical protein